MSDFRPEPQREPIDWSARLREAERDEELPEEPYDLTQLRGYEPVHPESPLRSLLRKLWVPIAFVGALFWKFKTVAVAVFKFKFLATALSGLVSVAAYAVLWGWWFAVGLVVLLFVHEMGHVLGIGSLWTEYGVANGEGTDSSSFTGPAARAAWESLGGAAGTRVPVENCVGFSSSQCGAGTKDSHWRERTFDNELMTGFLNGGVANPLSALTIASLQDIGYTVDMSIAEPYGPQVAVLCHTL